MHLGTCTSKGEAGVHAGCADLLKEDTSSPLPGNLAAGRRPSFAVNSVSAPLVDGSTLGSWLDNIFGPGEGDGKTRLTLMKTALLLLATAHGTPQFAAADLEGRELARFAPAALSARRQLSWLLAPPSFNAKRSIAWSTEYGGQPAWGGHGMPHAALVMCLRDVSAGSALGSALCLIINAGWEPVSVQLPPASGMSLWHVMLDSGADQPFDISIDRGGRPLRIGSNYTVAPKGAVLLVLQKPVQPASGAQAVY